MDKTSREYQDIKAGPHIKVNSVGVVMTFNDATHFDSTGNCPYEELWGKVFTHKDYQDKIVELEEKRET